MTHIRRRGARLCRTAGSRFSASRSLARWKVRGTILVTAAQLAAAACGDDEPTTPPPSGPARKPTMVIVSGDAQTAEVGTTLPAPLVVRVADTLGAPAARVVVRFSSSNTSAMDSSTTDAQGVASVHWTLGGRAEVQQISAGATVYPTGPNAVTAVTFTATALAGAPAEIAARGGHGAIGEPNAEVDSVVVVATDRFGNLSPSAPVSWVVTAGGGSIRALGNATDATGAARAIWVLGPSEGENALDVTAGTITRRLTATASTVFSAKAVVAGSAHTCALAPSGTPYCWGANSSGQLGIGRADDVVYNRPVRVVGGLSLVSLVAGATHTCGLAPGGDAYCWGNGRSGQLGADFVGLAAAPLRVHSEAGFTALAAGTSHTCGLTSARSVYCWGDDALGQLGRAEPRTYGSRPTSVAHPIPVASAEPFTAIAAGSFSTCAATANGETYCWGSNDQRELGRGDLPGRCAVIANQFFYDGTEQPCSTTPVPVSIGRPLHVLTASGSGWCGVSRFSELFCWGNRDAWPRLVAAVPMERAWVLGQDACVLSPEGAVACWGVWGRSNTPQVRPFGDDLDLSNLASGNAHWCGISRDVRSIVYCWGSNVSGQLGDGTTEHRFLPVASRPPGAN